MLDRRDFLKAAGILSSLSLAACSKPETPAQESETSSDSTTEQKLVKPEDMPYDKEGLLKAPLDNGFNEGFHHAVLTVKDYGVIKLELNAANAPITVSNFADLVQNKFYDGLSFHRIISGFMIQGGDPNHDGTGGSARRIKGEFLQNNVANPLRHVRGTISMARAQDMDSASSQFFIMHEDASNLDGQYAAFGKVTEGMEVVDAICEKVKPTDDNGTVPQDQQPIIESIELVD